MIVKKQDFKEVFMSSTLDYYEINAKAFVNSTRDIEFSEHQDRFLTYLKPGAKILDFGCGSGRDTKYFLSKGFIVDAIDGSAEFTRMASEYTQIEVRQMLFQELDEENTYDGIWACASILHLTQIELLDVLGKMARALVEEGIVYASFKYGTQETVRNGRFFIDMTEDKMECFLSQVNLFLVKDIWITSDARRGREDEKWLNIILQKKK